MKIIFEDKNIIAVNKPSGLVVFHESKDKEKEEPSLSSLIVEKFPETKGLGKERNGAVHRLDKETSGVVLFAKNKEAFSFLQKELLEQRAKKRYIALVFKVMKKKEGKIRTFVTRSPKDRRKQKAYKGFSGKREAVTFFKVIKDFQNYSLLKINPKTGRKHQIRCHLSFLGHPVAGDKLYRFKDQVDPHGLERQFLHAKAIKINTPTGEKTFKSDLAEDLKKVLKNLT